MQDGAPLVLARLLLGMQVRNRRAPDEKYRLWLRRATNLRGAVVQTARACGAGSAKTSSHMRNVTPHRQRVGMHVRAEITLKHFRCRPRGAFYGSVRMRTSASTLPMYFLRFFGFAYACEPLTISFRTNGRSAILAALASSGSVASRRLTHYTPPLLHAFSRG